jgi:hypothetical protein
MLSFIARRFFPHRRRLESNANARMIVWKVFALTLDPQIIL